MKPISRILICLALLCLAACQAPSTKPSKRTYSPLILISIDGFRANYFDRGITPTLKMLADDGVHATALQPSFPTLTFPNHYTLVTGLYPDHHGMVANTMWDPVLGKFAMSNRDAGRDRRWWDGGEPIWVTAEKQGLHTATMFWPGSEADTHGYRPDYYLPWDGKVSADERVDQVLQWIDLPADKRPQFITLYLDKVDHEGHEHGPDSTEVADAMRNYDAALARFIEELKKRDLYKNANIIIVSDHGMTSVDGSRFIILDKWIDLDDVNLVTAGVVTELTPKPGHEDVIDKMVAPHEHATCWRKGDVPARLHYGHNPRVPAVVCVAEDGWRIETQSFMDRPGHREDGGEHGYDNDDPNMRALFIAHGPAFKQGLVVPEFANVNVYPLLAHLLGVKPEANDGNLDVTRDMLRY